MSLHRAIIITTDKTTLKWKTLNSKLSEILKALNSIKNADFTLDIRYIDYIPEVVAGRITRASFDSVSLPLLKEGYDFVMIHMNQKQQKKWKIEPTLRGLAQNDTDEVAEAYFWANEKTLRGKYNQFIETSLHEVSHLFCYGSKYYDKTHLHHQLFGTITGIFNSYDMSEYQKTRFSLKKYMLSLKNMLLRQTYPVPQWNKPSQAYGVANSKWYPLTGHHIGTDFACPVGTPIKAHNDCVVTRSGYLPKSIGYWCEVQYENYYFVFCHLQSRPAHKILRAGEIIGYTGDTGFIDGVHLHVEGWHNPMNRQALTKNNWEVLTFDVTKKI